MVGWFKRVFNRKTGSSLPMKRELQNDWISSAFLKWQKQWHDYFDTDHDLIASGEFDRPIQLPANIDCDFRLIFGLSHANRQTREKCFAIFPEGKEMQRRFESFLQSKPVTISEVDVRARLLRIVDLIQMTDLKKDGDFSGVKIVNRDADEGLEELGRAENINILLDHSTSPVQTIDDLSKVAAHLFLTEPLYAAAGNHYHVRDWVTAAMKGGAMDALHLELYKLWSGGWQVFLSEDGLVLAHRAQ